jgi:hypothetical protein
LNTNTKQELPCPHQRATCLNTVNLCVCA